jgi:SAM-dependent methyltransferase
MTTSQRGAAAVFGEVEDLLACPRCAGSLAWRPPVIRCTACEVEFRQTRDDCVDLLASEAAVGESEPGWADRQQEMEAWYRDMVGTDWSRACFANDYGPFAPLLERYAGTILDLGGGVGVTRHFLRAHSRYVVVDPSTMWLGAEWGTLADAFPCLATPPAFVRGTGEALPFRRGVFDVVLAFWTINHAADPARMFAEVSRVLKRGGVFLVVLEDMEPRWRDVVRPTIRARGAREVVRVAGRKLAAALPGGAWPLQHDHIRIREQDLRAWSAAGFDTARRAWIGDYLTYEYVARSAP